ENDVGNGNVAGQAGQGVAAAGTAHAVDEFVAAQLAEQLLEIRKRDVLALADGCERDGAALLTQSQIYHGSDCKTPLGGQTHGCSLPATSCGRRRCARQYPTN